MNRTNQNRNLFFSLRSLKELQQTIKFIHLKKYCLGDTKTINKVSKKTYLEEFDDYCINFAGLLRSIEKTVQVS